MILIHFLACVLPWPLTLFAGPYQAVMFKFRTFPGRWRGVFAWAGILVVFPLSFDPGRNGEYIPGYICVRWTLILLAWVHMWSKWVYGAEPPLDDSVSQCRFGRAEPLLAIALAAVAHALCRMGQFFLLGYAASLTQIGLVRLRKRCEGWTQEDTARLLARFRADGLAPAAMQGAGLASSAMRSGVIPLGASVLRGVKLLFGGARVETAAAGGVVAARSPSFMGRVMSHMVASFFVSSLMGGFSIWGVLKVVSIVGAFFLSLAGWRVQPPDSVRDEARTLRARARELYEDKKEEAMERFEAGKDRAMERLEDGKEELKEEIGRKKREAVRDFFFNW